MMRVTLIGLALIAAIPAAAQNRITPVDREDPQATQQSRPQPMPAQSDRAGRVATSSVGEVGQRQTREQMAPNTQPMARIASRINTRVQNRIRTRIDRNYSPQANATSPFAVAEEQARTSSRRRR